MLHPQRRQKLSLTLLLASAALALPATTFAADTTTITAGRLQEEVVNGYVEDGEIVLKGNIADETMGVPAGDDLQIELIDCETHYLHAMTLGEDGRESETWARDRKQGRSETTFGGVVDEIRWVVIAVEKKTGEIKYGPVITVKPKG